MSTIYILDTTNLNPDYKIYQNIPSNRLEKIKKSTNINYIKESLGAQLLLNKILKERFLLDLNKIEYIYNENFKPYLKDIPIYFSITHSNNIVCLAVEKYTEIGIDLELIKKHNTCVAKKIMNDKEYEIYQKIKTFNDEQNNYFYELWTKKESYVKRYGTSITINPKNIDISKGEQNNEFISKIIEINNKQYVLSTCGITKIKIEEVQIPSMYKINN